jgi:hypothetical protein
MPAGLSADAADVMWLAGDKTDKNRRSLVRWMMRSVASAVSVMSRPATVPVIRSCQHLKLKGLQPKTIEAYARAPSAASASASMGKSTTLPPQRRADSPVPVKGPSRSVSGFPHDL